MTAMPLDETTATIDPDPIVSTHPFECQVGIESLDETVEVNTVDRVGQPTGTDQL